MVTHPTRRRPADQRRGRRWCASLLATAMVATLFAAPPFAAPAPAEADVSGVTASLVADIHEGSGDYLLSFPLQGFADLDGVAIFSARDETRDTQIWRSNGTEGGTGAITDPEDLTATPLDVTAVGDRVFFTASRGPDLYVTDGTEGGTKKVADPPGRADRPAKLTALDEDRVVFRFHVDEQGGDEPWVSDGTEEGTFRLADIRSGLGDSDPDNFTPFGADELVFGADGGDGPELWRTNGTTGAPVRVSDDVEPAAGGSMAALGDGTVLFRGTGDVDGTTVVDELWRTDGTDGGTTLVKDIWPGADLSSEPR